MTETLSPGKSAMNYAITFGIIMILEFVIMYVLDINPQESPIVGAVINILNYLVLPTEVLSFGGLTSKVTK